MTDGNMTWSTETETTNGQSTRQTRGVRDQLRTEGRNIQARITQEVGRSVKDQTSKLASNARTYQQAVSRAIEQLERQDHQYAARYLRGLESRMEKFSAYLADREPREILDDISGVARRHPVEFYGGLFLLGLGLGRLLKISTSESEEESPQRLHEYSEMGSATTPTTSSPTPNPYQTAGPQSYSSATPSETSTTGGTTSGEARRSGQSTGIESEESR